MMGKTNKYKFFHQAETPINELKNSSSSDLKKRIKIEESKERKNTIKHILLFVVVIIFVSLYLYI